MEEKQTRLQNCLLPSFSFMNILNPLRPQVSSCHRSLSTLLADVHNILLPRVPRGTIIPLTLILHMAFTLLHVCLHCCYPGLPGFPSRLSSLVTFRDGLVSGLERCHSFEFSSIQGRLSWALQRFDNVTIDNFSWLSVGDRLMIFLRG